MQTPGLSPVASELHRRLLVCNVHDDWSIEVQKLFLAGERGALDRTYGPRMRAGGIGFSFYTVGGDDVMFTQDPDLLRGTLRGFDGGLLEIDASGHFRLCLNAADIIAARDTGHIGLMLTIEGAGPIGEDLAILRGFHRLGLRSVILTWFKANPVGDGVGEKRNGGLTTFGREAVMEMGRLGILIDITQSAPATIDDVLSISSAPVIASHSNCSGVYEHRRNLSNEQLRGILATGGLVGITAYPAHVGSGEVSLDDFLAHVDYAVKLIGIDHVGIGLNIVVHSPEEARAFYERSQIEYSSFHLPGIEDVDRMPAITAGLLKRGYGEAEVAKIMGTNLLRVIQEVMG
jgi:membrane dipeptidase